MDLFKRKTKPCIICGKIASHMHKPKKEWNLEGKLCGECHVDKTKEYYEGKARQPCVTCGTSYKITDLWEPRWQWDMEGLLCKACFDKKESSHDKKKNFCVLCGAKMGIIRYNPKPKWKVNGNLCRKCWDGQKAQFG